MKNLISFILITAMILSVTSPAFATENSISTLEETTVFVYNGHGEYILTDENHIFKINNVNSLKVGDKITALPTDDEEFYKIYNSDKYLAKTSNDKYLLTDKIDIDIQNFNNNMRVFEQYNISEFLKEDIQTVIEEQNELGNISFKIELFAPSLNILDENISTMAIEPLGTQYYTFYYRGKSHNMKDYSVKYSGLNSKMIEEGTSTLNTAKSFVSLVISSAGGIHEVLNAFGTYAGIALSAYDLFKSIRGEVISGSSSDSISTNLIYARIVKETYAQDLVSKNYPNAGCVSHKVWLDHNETYHYYRSKGSGELTSTPLRKEIYTEHFKNPAPIAIDNGISTTHYDFPLKTTVYGKTVRLTGN